MENVINTYLSELLEMEISGKEAISAPTNWLKKPLLSVETEIDRDIERISSSLVSKDGNTRGVWWFLIGSPGNGKSAAVGSLVRTLKAQQNVTFEEPIEGQRKGRNIEDMEPDELPYLLELHEENNSYASALFAQDASVVPNPYDRNPNTGEALIQLMDDAYSRGLSLVVCANRGVIEKAIQTPDVKKKEWYKILLSLQDSAGRDLAAEDLHKFPQAKNNVFQQFSVEQTILDRKSIISDGHLKSLIANATSGNNWGICSNCRAKDVCPFKANRDWLNSAEGSERFNNIMRYAELMDGQAIVFREAIALIALLLAGNSRDYGDASPCEWVHEKQENGLYFSLLARRVYMTVFRSYSPQGLKTNQAMKNEQLNVILSNKSNCETQSKRAIEGLKSEKIAIENGITRLLSYQGICSKLDPVKENQGKKLERRWNISCSNIESIEENLLITKLEKICFEIWADLENSIENINKKDDEHSYYRNLRRWITSVTYRIGFMSEGKILFEEELEDYQRIISINLNQDNDVDDEVLNLKKELETSLKNFVFGEGDTSIRISDSFKVSGDAITSQLKPKIESKEDQNSNRMTIKIGKGLIEISPKTYVWLKRISTTGLSSTTVPPEVRQIADDIRKRTASVINYAYEKEIDVDITKPNGEIIKLTRDENRYIRRNS